jgi:hypothetical protein
MTALEKGRELGGKRGQEVGCQGASAGPTLDYVKLPRVRKQGVNLGHVLGEQLAERGRGLGACKEVAPGTDIGTARVVAVLRVVERPLHETSDGNRAVCLYLSPDVRGEQFST